jgi:site-specific DNA recombinase
VFEDEGHSGAMLVRPTLDRLRGPSRPRLRRRGAVLFTGPAGLQVRVPGAAGRVVRQGRGVGGVRQRPRGDSPQDQPLIQFQGMFAEYEKAS